MKIDKKNNLNKNNIESTKGIYYNKPDCDIY